MANPFNYPPLNPKPRLLMGPGPSNTHPRVSSALGAPTVGHMDPQFLTLMDQIKAMLQGIFNTANELTLPVSGTGSAGMECCLVNILQPGDRIVIVQNGVFGGRLANLARRITDQVEVIEVPFGEAVDPQRVRDTIGGKATHMVAVVHAETSTGVCQSLAEIGAMAHEVDALFLADCVTSLGGQEVRLDEWGVDLAFSGTQKCLSCPPGLSPVSFSPRAVDVIKKRTSPVSSWYLDMTMLLNYWGGERVYHHTAPINMLYGLREALMVFFEEGPQTVFARHRHMHQSFVAGVEAMGLKMLVAPQQRLAQLNTVVIPDGVDDALVRSRLLNEFNLEIGGGLGSLKGKVWRVGLMGQTCQRQNVMLLLAALETILASQNAPIQKGQALSAAAAV